MSTVDPLAGMTRDLRLSFNLWPGPMKQAYIEYWENRGEGRGSHRDTLKAFEAGWDARSRLFIESRGNP